ncbi:MAG TPA: hypothetical protein VFE62_11465, partial [Gemmataceae bacterium]|nr:hypothetical protein [Gemmataceae bacterium]
NDDGLLDALRGERAASHQMFMNLNNGELRLSALLNAGSPPGATRSFSERVVDVFPNVILRQYPEYLRGMNEQIRICKLDPKTRDEKLQDQEQQVRANGNMLMRLMLPAIGKVSHAASRSQALLRSATVAVAAERYRVKHGAWPAAPTDLVKDGLIAKLPDDPYDGKPLRWKRTQTGVIVYSVGPDITDNGGTFNRSNPTASGADLGFELFDPAHHGRPAPIGD